MEKLKNIHRALNLKEKTLFYFLITLLVGSTLGWGAMFYYSKTTAVPDYGGEYIEGIVGQPLHINPILSPSNSTDEDISQLIFSGLLKYDNQGKITNDLAESYEISEDKTFYTFHLKKNVLWHDGRPLTASDVIFTINLLSDPAYRSPLRVNWQGIKAAAIDDSTLSFQIDNSYTGFLNNLTFGILPKHIWESISSDRFPLSEINLEPIGTGPYKYVSMQKDSKGNIISYKLTSNPNYFEGKPYISKMTFNFYPDDESIIHAYNTKEIMGINSVDPQKISELKLLQSTKIHKFNLPRYFAVFFNQIKSAPLANDEVREALACATDKSELISHVLEDSGMTVFSPILPGMIGYDENLDKCDFNLDKANEILNNNNWTRGEDGIRAKDGTVLEFTLTTTDWDALVQTATILKSQWEKVGVRVNINSNSISDVQQNYIRPREYEALLFGQVMGAEPDPYSFWHSNNKKDPGLNLALFGDDETDKLIDEGRREFDTEKRASIYRDFQKKLIAEKPAVFLYSPSYIYPVGKKISGINITNLVSPAERFSDANHWYIKTKRVWKK